MENPVFKLGDVVRLKSGGQKMTVAHIEKQFGGLPVKITCQWFDENNKLKNGKFYLSALELCESPTDKTD